MQNVNKDNILFKSTLDLSVMERAKIKEMLPNWKTKIMEIVHLKNSNFQVKCCINATTVKNIQQWIHAYEEQTNSTYSIKSTEKVSGKFVDFKQRLYCHHNTVCPRTYEKHKKNKTRNTNCPANINITLRAIKKVYRGKDPSKAPDPEMPCEIVLQPKHNHETNSPDALRFQAVSTQTRENLLQLFKQGHTPASALKSLKLDIQLNDEDCERILANRKYCPDYNYCYHLYMTQVDKKSIPMEIDGVVNNDFNCKSSNNLLDIDNSMKGNLKVENMRIIEEIKNSFISFSEKSPLEVGTALRKMKENLGNLKTVSAFATSCATFAMGLKKDLYCKSLVPVVKRKTNLTGKVVHIGGISRKRNIVLKKKCHILINQIKNV